MREERPLQLHQQALPIILFSRTINVGVELWYSLDSMRVFILGVGATGSLLAKLLIRQGH